MERQRSLYSCQTSMRKKRSVISISSMATMRRVSTGWRCSSKRPSPTSARAIVLAPRVRVLSTAQVLPATYSSRWATPTSVPHRATNMPATFLLPVVRCSVATWYSVGHVGIVVDVDPVTFEFTFIHASSKNGAKLSSSSDSNYAKRYVGARRIQDFTAL